MALCDEEREGGDSSKLTAIAMTWVVAVIVVVASDVVAAAAHVVVVVHVAIVVVIIVVVCQILCAIAITSCLVIGAVVVVIVVASVAAVVVSVVHTIIVIAVSVADVVVVVANGIAVIFNAKFERLLRGRPSWQGVWRLSHIKFLDSQHAAAVGPLLLSSNDGVWNASVCCLGSQVYSLVCDSTPFLYYSFRLRYIHNKFLVSFFLVKFNDYLKIYCTSFAMGNRVWCTLIMQFQFQGI